MAEGALAHCNTCGLAYHLNQRNDRPGQDCGQVWIDDENLTLEFRCDRCMALDSQGGSLDDVLDIAEAAVLAGMTESDLRARADSGQIAHRKTQGGMYLFERREVVGFIQGRQ
jgi:hypothetical protein